MVGKRLILLWLIVGFAGVFIFSSILGKPAVGKGRSAKPPQLYLSDEVLPAYVPPATRTGRYSIGDKGVNRKLFYSICRSYKAKLKKGKPTPKKKGGEGDEEKAEEAHCRWNVYVPPHYKPGTQFGLLVFVNSCPGNLPQGRWQKLFDKYNLIWIGPANAGNKCYVPWRQALSVDSVRQILKAGYSIDPGRIYVAGASGGGRMSSRIAVMHSNIFTGNIPIIGVDYFRNVPVPGKKGFSRGPSYHPSAAAIRRAKRNSRICIIAGEKDKINRPEGMGAVAKTMKKDGFKYVQFFVMPGVGHDRPSAKWMDKAFQFLDAPLAGSAKKAYEKGLKHLKAPKLGLALQAFTRAAGRGWEQDFLEDAAKQRDELFSQWQSDIAELEKLLEPLDKRQANKQLKELCKKWTTYAKKYKKTFQKRIKQAEKKKKASGDK
ncbi:MAG: prolyl oligopeptidase family serine peptidase [Phycisphaerae bacterium]|nr:prolyl oligopeptidase family serine peptidase [Phycisphaerae bacterium]